MQKKNQSKAKAATAEPPAWHLLPVINISDDAQRWLQHYWQKLELPAAEQERLAITQDRREFARWTGRRLNSLALGCYCYLPGTHDTAHHNNHAAVVNEPGYHPDIMPTRQMSLPGIDATTASLLRSPTRTRTSVRHRHLIFIEKDLVPLGIEVTVAHELIHLSDRFRGQPRRHHCHGYDAIAVDEAAITGYDPDMLRQLLRDESARREKSLRAVRPVKYQYVCKHCGKLYPRVRRYPRPVSCGACDRAYNPKYLLVLQSSATVTADVDIDDES